MTKPPVSIELSSNDTDNFSISLSKEGFSHLFESLLSSPREQSEAKFLGFDITLDDMKVIVEKILMHVRTQNNLLNFNFTGQIFFSDGSDIAAYSLDSFFGTSLDGMPKPIRFSVTLKLIVGFNRQAGKLSYEQQNVCLTVNSGSIGASHISVRSTDFSWPQSIFLLYSKCIEELNRKVNPKQITSTNKLLLLAPAFLKDQQDHPFEYLVRNAKNKINSMRGILAASLLFSAFLMYFTVLVIEIERSSSYLFNPETRAFELHTITEAEVSDWEGIAERYRLSRELYRTGQFSFKEEKSHFRRVLETMVANFSISTLAVGIAVALYFYFCFLDAKRLETIQEGRLFLKRDHVTRRVGSEQFPGIFYSIIAGLFTAAITEFIASILR